MNTMKRQVNRNRCEHRPQFSKFHNFSAYIGLLILSVCFISLTLFAEDTAVQEVQPPATDGQASDTAEGEATVSEMTREIITGTSKRMESYEQEGITILIDEAKTVRRTEEGIEVGYLNADRITLKRDVETGTTKEIVAEGNVEIRDQDIFATCDHAIMDNVTSLITLKENVVVLQNKDRLETKFFTFNRVTGKQTAEGDVKFKVTVTQAAPVNPEADEGAEGNTDTGEGQTSEEDVPQSQSQSDMDADTGNSAQGDTEAGSEAEDQGVEEPTGADAEDAEDEGTESD